MCLFFLKCVLPDPPRKVKSTPHIADVVSKSDGALVSGSVSFADAGQMVMTCCLFCVCCLMCLFLKRELASSAGAANGSPDVLRARSKTMSASGSPLNQRPTLKVVMMTDKEAHFLTLSFRRDLRHPLDTRAKTAIRLVEIERGAILLPCFIEVGKPCLFLSLSVFLKDIRKKNRVWSDKFGTNFFGHCVFQQFDSVWQQEFRGSQLGRIGRRRRCIGCCIRVAGAETVASPHNSWRLEEEACLI
jgi:hypothetical protein